ncbi:sulfotransferase family 2 domain-containing protein [Acidithiobacillus sp. MC6.1]|nr:sulfotransferase family 2 domain-containing protein [Acidithiobacillus sp. MC6.1]
MTKHDMENPDSMVDLDARIAENLRFGSVYLPDKGLHFIATPKAACTAIKWWLANLESADWSLVNGLDSMESEPSLRIHDLLQRALPHAVSKDIPALFDACADPKVFRFAFVRNPYTRAFSGWLSKLAVQEAEQIGNYREAAFARMPLRNREEVRQAFEAFLQYLLESEAPDRWKDPHWIPQTLLLRSDRIHYSQIFPVEEMAAAMQTLTNKLNSQGLTAVPTLGRYNESLFPYARSYLTEQSIALIRQLYASDFQAFGYDPEIVPAGKAFPDAVLEGILTTLPRIVGRNQSLGDLQAILQEGRIALQSARQELQCARLELRSTQETVRLQWQTIEDHMKEEERLQWIINNKQEEIQRITQSRSWRITRPMRVMATFLRGVRQRVRDFTKKSGKER